MSNKNPKSGLDPELIKKAQENAEKFAKIQRNTLAESAKVLKDIEERQVKIADLEEQIAEATGNTKKALQAKLAGQKQYLAISQQVLKEEQKRTALVQELNDITKDIQVKYDNILDVTLDQQSASKKLTELVKRRIHAVKENNEMEIALLSVAIDQQLAYKAQLPYLQRVQETFSQINDVAQDLAGSISGAFDSLPGGKYLSKMLGLDTLGETFKNSINDAGKAFIESGGSITEATKAFGGSIKALINPVTLVAAALAGIYLVMNNITEQAKTFAIETGLTVSASQRLIEQSYSLQASYSNQLSSQEDILAVQQELIGTLGPIAQLSGDVALRVSETGKAFGYGAQEAAKVQSEMMQIAGFNEKAAIEAQEFTAQLALANGVAPGAVMKDIAKSSAVSAKYFAGSPKALGKAAVEAAKLGLSLDQMAKTSEALLNIEQSLEDQYAASAMLGRQLNFDAARRAAIEGDIATATKEVLKQLGGIDEFESASVFAKERMAAAAGMTVDELSKSLAIEARRGELSDDQLTAMSGLNLSISEIKTMNAEDLKTRLAQQQATEQLSVTFEKIKSALVRFILPIAKALMPIFEGIAGLVEGILAPFQIIGDLLGKFIGWINQFTGGLGMSIDMGKTLAVTLKGIGVLLGVMAVKGIISAITSIFSSLGAIPFIGVGLAAAAVGGLFAAIGSGTSLVQSKMNDGEVGPIGPSGYSRVMTSPEGSIAFNDKDTIVAGTNLGGGGSTNIDYDKLGTAVAKAIQNLKIIIDESAVAAINKRGAVQASYR